MNATINPILADLLVQLEAIDQDTAPCSVRYATARKAIEATDGLSKEERAALFNGIGQTLGGTLNPPVKKGLREFWSFADGTVAACTSRAEKPAKLSLNVMQQAFVSAGMQI